MIKSILILGLVLGLSACDQGWKDRANKDIETAVCTEGQMEKVKAHYEWMSKNTEYVNQYKYAESIRKFCTASTEKQND